MERLTDKKEADAQRQEYEKRLKNGYPRNIQEERFLKLAAYEDTDLEPEEAEAQSIALAQCKPYIDAICDEHGKMLINPIRLAALAQAEKDGRLVVLPVPVGKNKLVYALPDSFSRNQEIFTIECERIDGLEIWENPGREIVVIVDGCEIGESDIGKTVFLTCEEAEAALKKREADLGETH